MASGISVKGYSSGLFRNEIELTGEYANKIRFLRDDIKVFNSFRDAYLTAAVVGFRCKRKGAIDNVDKGEKGSVASIFPNELSGRLPDLKLVYRTIMLLDEVENFSTEQYGDRAFRDDASVDDVSNLKNNYALFNSYVCGGLDILYDMFKDFDLRQSDDLIDVVCKFIRDYAVDAGLIDHVPELPEFDVEDDDDNI